MSTAFRPTSFAFVATALVAPNPLYTYAGDSAPGPASGQAIDDFGAEWYALSAAGNRIGED